MRNNLSQIILWTILIVFTVLVFFHIPNNILSWDTFGAYLYLPATFIYHDPTLTDISWVNQINETYQSSETLYQIWGTETGNHMIRYPMGFSILFSPFFFIGHFFAWLLDYPMDGFSRPYQVAIFFGNWAYVVIGIYYLRKLLKLFFDDLLTALLLLILLLATNYNFTILYMAGMPHGYLFSFYVFILYFTIKWHEKPNTKYSILLGLSLGLASLARASEILAILIPLFWNCYNKASCIDKVNFLKQNKSALFKTIGIFILVGIPQLIYFKITSGYLFVDSYHNNGEGFDLLHPHIINFLFSFRKGWLFYTPVMFFALLGIYLILKNKEKYAFSFLIFTLLNIYILSSWTCWWYAESYGQRSLIQSYPILLIALGYLIKKAFAKNFTKYSLLLFFGLFTFMNFFHIWQMNHGLLHPSRTTKESYLANFLSTTPAENYQQLLLIDQSILPEDRVAEKKVVKTVFEGFESNDIEKSRLSEDAFDGKYSNIVDSSNIYSLTIEKPFNELEFTDPNLYVLKISAWIKPKTELSELKPTLVSKFLYGRKPYGDFAKDIEEISTEEIQLNQWNPVSMYRYIPTVRKAKDKLQVFVYIRGKGKMLVDNLKVEVIKIDKR